MLPKLVAIIINGALSLVGFILPCVKHETFPNFLSYHFTIQQESFIYKGTKSWNMPCSQLSSIVNYIRLASTLLSISDAENSHVVFLLMQRERGLVKRQHWNDSAVDVMGSRNFLNPLRWIITKSLIKPHSSQIVLLCC